LRGDFDREVTSHTTAFGVSAPKSNSFVVFTALHAKRGKKLAKRYAWSNAKRTGTLPSASCAI